MAESLDVQTQLKKRARRRLIGAVAFAGLAAVVLPMVMDEEPKQQMQDVQIRIPGQDQSPFAPSVSAESLRALQRSQSFALFSVGSSTEICSIRVHN